MLELVHLDGTRELVTKVREASAAGALSTDEEAHILSTALRHRPLPELVPLPPNLPALPDHYPEDDEAEDSGGRVQDAFFFTAEQNHHLASLEQEWEDGKLSLAEFRSRAFSVMNTGNPETTTDPDAPSEGGVGA